MNLPRSNKVIANYNRLRSSKCDGLTVVGVKKEIITLRSHRSSLTLFISSATVPRQLE